MRAGDRKCRFGLLLVLVCCCLLDVKKMKQANETKANQSEQKSISESLFTWFSFSRFVRLAASFVCLDFCFFGAEVVSVIGVRSLVCLSDDLLRSSSHLWPTIEQSKEKQSKLCQMKAEEQFCFVLFCFTFG